MASKKGDYQKLINDVRDFYINEGHASADTSQKIYLKWCDDCEEINLWTYWQGRGSLNARIMLVGQDWGCPEESCVMDNIRAINAEKSCRYHIDESSITDRNLIELFKILGYDISNEAGYDSDLFFTNFVLGYRNKGLTGGFATSWVKESAPFFHRLLDIIEPQIVICLGKHPFIGVMYSLDKKIDYSNYNEFIVSSQNPVMYETKKGKKIAIFAVAHCGSLGTLNRNRPADPSGKDGMTLQKEDWARIRDYFDASNSPK